MFYELFVYLLQRFRFFGNFFPTSINANESLQSLSCPPPFLFPFPAQPLMSTHKLDIRKGFGSYKSYFIVQAGRRGSLSFPSFKHQSLIPKPTVTLIFQNYYSNLQKLSTILNLSFAPVGALNSFSNSFFSSSPPFLNTNQR